MPSRARLTPNAAKILVITGCWTLFLVAGQVNTYLFVGDLLRLGKLTGAYGFWPDFWGNVVVGVVTGALGGALLVFKLNAGYRHKTFLSGILTSTAVFLVSYVTLAVVLLFVMPFALYGLTNGLAEGFDRGVYNLGVNLYTPSFLTSMCFFGLLVGGTQFMLQVNDKFGPGVLWKLVTGKYYHPRDEERVFMFLDLRSSTEIAERIGHKLFFELLRELFQDVTKPIIDSRGDIYQYVGDEVVITWPVQRGIENGNCIACYFRIEEVLTARSEEYLRRFGVRPDFKAGVHVGAATVGEIGVLKKDIVFSGDVLNTTSRIQEECNRYDVNLLASSDLLRRVSLGADYLAVPLGEIWLRGKSEALELSSVQPAFAMS